MVRRGAKKKTENKVLKANLSSQLARTTVVPILAAADGPILISGCAPSHAWLALAAVFSESAIQVASPGLNSHGLDDMPKYLPAGWAEHVLDIFAVLSPSYYVTDDDVPIR